MFPDFKTYFLEMILVEYQNYERSLRESSFGRHITLKHSIQFSTNLFHLRENLPREIALSRTEAESVCPNYKVLADFVNVTKHGKIDRNSPLILDSSQISEVVINTMFNDEQGEYSVYRKDLELSLNDGRVQMLSEVLRDCYTFLSSYLVEKNAISDYIPFFPLPGRELLGREKSRELTLEIVSGYPFGMKMQLLRFDLDAGREVPIDLTGSQIEGRIYVPKPIEYEIALKKDSTGEEEKKVVTLSQQEAERYRQLQSQAGKENFLNNLPSVVAAMLELKKELDEEDSPV